MKYIFSLYYKSTGKIAGQHTAEADRYLDAVEQVKSTIRDDLMADFKNVLTVDDKGKEIMLRL